MALLNEISIARTSQVPMNESFRVFCHMIKLFVLSSTNKAESMIQSRAHPR